MKIIGFLDLSGGRMGIKTGLFGLVLVLACFGLTIPDNSWAVLEKSEQMDPLIAGPWVGLRKSPTFTAPVVALAPTWGPSIPMDDIFEVERVYGRWLFGKPLPLRNMKKKDYAPSGWIYTRMIVLPGDQALESMEQRDLVFHANVYTNEAWKTLGMPSQSNTLNYFYFLESLIVSKNTLQAFGASDDGGAIGKLYWPNFISSAQAADAPKDETPKTDATKAGPANQSAQKVEQGKVAESALKEEAKPAVAEEENTGKKKVELIIPEKPEGPPLGLSGMHLEFLDQAAKQVQVRKAKERKAREALILKPREIRKISPAVKDIVLARIITERKLRLPSLTHEEVDGNMYMRAIVWRTLRACPAGVQDYWKDKHWFHFRMLGLKERPNEKDAWYQYRLPGGNYAISNRAILSARNEAEMAFVLIRPMVRENRLESISSSAEGDNWASALNASTEKTWSAIEKTQSLKFNKGMDVADEIAVDMLASECLARAGYHWQAGLNYLQRMKSNRDQAWAAWFMENNTGFDYRLEQFKTSLERSIKQRNIPEANVLNQKRFERAVVQWNTMG